MAQRIVLRLKNEGSPQNLTGKNIELVLYTVFSVLSDKREKACARSNLQ